MIGFHRVTSITANTIEDATWVELIFDSRAEGTVQLTLYLERPGLPGEPILPNPELAQALAKAINEAGTFVPERQCSE